MFVHDSFSVSTRSNHQRCSTKKDVLKNFTKFTEKHLCQSLFFNKAAGTPFMNTFYYRIPMVAASIHSLSHLIRFDHFIYDWIILLWTLWLTILWLFIILLRMTAPMIWLSFLFLILVLPFLSNESFSAFNDPFYFIIKLPPGESNSPPGKFPPRKFPPMFLNIPNHVF